MIEISIVSDFMFIMPTDLPIKRTCSKCGKTFIQRETRTCTSLNNFIPICLSCQAKKDKAEAKGALKEIFSVFNKDKNDDD